ncbi:thiamine-phosphate kinase [Acidihalobacter yilgarnensis]|uniref:Thiamine-monophosphate kinase n=1 Tax=Acidihalobacter yilgarnensis TaxID=2819280 RepID=A0A1D8ILG4_9GAMM|nr:thiamine-phosphate kinase [Acidihalobacter yilgarnensis]AOU97302.1 thiamine-phosphate kinase [Acidihalobacter yilgarnensis]
MSGEFDLIARHFSRCPPRDDVCLGVGDDAALLRPPSGQVLVATVDTLIAGVHFPEQTAPEDIGHKSLAVNLSDLAAMGAEPAWVTLAISLPKVDDRWLYAFAEGFYALAARHRVALVGGDTTRGPLCITVQALGWVPEGEALRRTGARPGDDIYVTGTLGDAGLGLAVVQSRIQVDPAHREALLARLNRPEPRIETGLALRGLASAAIDISDGLAADLGHLLEASGVGARVELDRLPRSDAVRLADPHGRLALTAGDDYELAFTLPPGCEADLARYAERLPPYTRIGRVEAVPGLRLIDAQGNPFAFSHRGYDHFRES